MKLAGLVFSALGVLAGLMVAAGAASAQDAVHLTPTSLIFHVNQGKSASQTVTLTNNAGSLVASISKIDIGPQCCGAGRFSVVSHTCGATLKRGQSCTITVRFAAKGSAVTKANLEVDFVIVGVRQTATTALTGTIGSTD